VRKTINDFRRYVKTLNWSVYAKRLMADQESRYFPDPYSHYSQTQDIQVRMLSGHDDVAMSNDYG
jgi:hypothetical protein